MPTAIAVTSPDLVLPIPGRQAPSVLALGHPREQSLEEALAEVSAVLEQHGFLIALHPAVTSAVVVRRLHTVRAVLETDRLALLPLPLPPLAVAVIARQLAQLSAADLGPGVLATAARLLAHYVHAGAVLGSVARLDRVPVSLGAHAKSWVPGTQFAVVAAPRPQLVKVGRDAPPAGPDYATGLVHAPGRLDSDWVSRDLAARWRVQTVERTPLPAASVPWWATEKVCEFAAGITDALVLSRLIGSVQRARCPWCGLEIIGDRCVVCAAPVPARAPSGGSGPGGSGPGGSGGPGAPPSAPPPPSSPPDPRLQPAVQPGIRKPPPAINR